MLTVYRYPNRRLYSPSEHKYVNFYYLKKMLKNNEEFRVINFKDKMDVTKRYLLMLITYDDRLVDRCFSEKILTDEIHNKVKDMVL